MATTQKPANKATKRVSNESNFLDNINPKFLNPIFIGVIFLLLIIFFGGVIFSDKIFASSDNISWESFQPFLKDITDKGELPLWLPHIFSGLPGFAALLVTGNRWWDLGLKLLNIFESIFGVVNHDVMRVVFHYFIYGTGMYLLMRSKKVNPMNALFTSIAAVFSTWIIIYIMIGHNTKIWALMAFPFIYLCLEKLIEKWSLLYAGLLVLAIHLMWESTHLQTVFYGACALGLYLLLEFINAFTNKSDDGKSKINGVLRAALMLALAGGLTYGMGLDRNLSVQEYLKYSTRGAKAIVENPNDKLTEDGGHGYDYATGWSFSPSETITYIVPSYFGFGNVVKNGEKQNYYWGQMAFTDAAHYSGIAVLILAAIGFWAYRKNPFVQSLLAIGLFGLILSYGKNMSLLYDLFYNYFPSFNKFRAPSQSLVLLEFVLPILAGFGVKAIIDLRNSTEPASLLTTKALHNILIGCVGLVVLVSGYAMIGDYKAEVVSSMKEKLKGENAPPEQIQAYAENIASSAADMMRSDAFMAILFAGLTFLLVWLYNKGTLKQFAFSAALVALVVIDLWRVAYRPMESQARSEAMAVFQTTDADEFIMKDKSHFRIMDVTTQANYVAHRKFDHILGYHAAKMRSYQDLLDICGNGNVVTSPTAWNMLNTKYIIAKDKMQGMENFKEVFSSQMTGAKIFENPNAMPRAWFVNKVQTATPKTILENIRDSKFDLKDVAFVEESFSAKIDPVGNTTPKQIVDSTDTTKAIETSNNAGSGATANVTKIEPNHITLEVNATGNNFLVLSEMYYAPTWHATLDGKPLEIVRANYLLRGMVIPSGKHTIQLDCSSSAVETGKWASLGLNLLMFAMIGIGFMQERKQTN